jgi:hypothetical protein
MYASSYAWSDRMAKVRVVFKGVSTAEVGEVECWGAVSGTVSGREAGECAQTV